jgi:hypothetical protein
MYGFLFNTMTHNTADPFGYSRGGGYNDTTSFPPSQSSADTGMSYLDKSWSKGLMIVSFNGSMIVSFRVRLNNDPSSLSYAIVVGLAVVGNGSGGGVSASVGITVGAAVGTSVGTSVGELVGVIDGVSVGVDVVGVAVVGIIVGYNVGDSIRNPMDFPILCNVVLSDEDKSLSNGSMIVLFGVRLIGLVIPTNDKKQTQWQSWTKQLTSSCCK